MNYDIDLTLTNAWQKGKTLANADTDQEALPSNLLYVTVTNSTNVVIYVKSTRKGTPAGIGRAIASGASFNYFSLNLDTTYFKAASAPTGKVIVSGVSDE